MVTSFLMSVIIEKKFLMILLLEVREKIDFIDLTKAMIDMRDEGEGTKR